MKRMIAQRMIRKGENFDNSAQEIFGDEINDVCKAFAQADTFEAAERKFSIKTLWRSGGRASEPGAMSLNSLRWNRLHSAAVALRRRHACPALLDLGPLARAMSPEVERALCADDAVGPPSIAALCRPLPEVRRAPSPSLCASTGEARRLFPQELNLLYDSKCAVCRWEVDFLSARDSEGKLTYTDVESPEYDETAARNGRVDYGTALASFHAVRSDGEVLRGMQVFQEAYKAVGLGWVWAIYENPVAHAILDAGYGLFARCRTYLTRGTSLEALNAARRARRADLNQLM